MIQPNELRMGSLIEKDNVMYKFLSLEQNHTSTSEYRWYWVETLDGKLGKYYSSHFNPIPLTPEILEKCGFEKVENPKQYGWYISVGNRELCWCHADYISLEFKVGQLDDFCDTIKDIDCKHLHQLQNLYFALTGEELIYKNEN